MFKNIIDKFRRYKVFNNWCLQKDIAQVNVNPETRISNNERSETLHDTLLDVSNRIAKNEISSLQYDKQTPKGKYEINGHGAEIQALTLLAQNPFGVLSINDLTIIRCNLSNEPGLEKRPFVFSNCEIAWLEVHGNASVVLENTKIGTLYISEVGLVEVKGGCILHIEVSTPGKSIPITGSVLFSKTFFPRVASGYLLSGAQPYRNMRHHLRSIENGNMANFFHSAELAVERADDSHLNKFISYSYEWLSDFGSSALRPLLWWVLLYLCAAAIIFHSDGSVRAFLTDDNYQGWRKVLIDNSPWYNDLLRANYLSLRSMINPLGLFGIRELIVPAYGWLVAILSFFGLMSVTLITLFILAIRRRFKMQL